MGETEAVGYFFLGKDWGGAISMEDSLCGL